MPERNDETWPLTSGRTGHQARSVGQGQWVVSFLPGRTLSQEQARAALRVADEVDVLRGYAGALGLTVLELVGLATMESSGQRLWSLGDAAPVLGRLEQAR
ncbi:MULTISPECIES: hypothetical protein [Nocardia]|uniref:hypothetical protein n=1 Tax=Nocardia TaxID=1817 RepID=UPI0019152867|nr:MULTISPECIES: hypothetical protein [Nocardia]